MGMSWTPEQKQVIELRGRNILVSAAAGSGKTAVLVQRIINIITDREKPVDIDRLLIVTFTNAAAAEMRGRIGAAIERALEENPQNEHLMRQLTLIHNAQITTIDSFCLFVIRNYFYEIGLEPNFRIADEGELKLLKEDVLKELLEQNYEEGQSAFLSFVENYAFGRNDEALGGMILSLYEFSRSYPWPDEWLSFCAGGYHITTEEAFSGAPFLGPLVETIRACAADLVSMMEQALLLCEGDGPSMYEKTIRDDLGQYQHIAEQKTFGGLYESIYALQYARMPSSRGFDGDAVKLDLVKSLRNTAKDTVKKIKAQYFYSPIEQMIENIGRTEPMAKELVRLASSFSEQFAEKKRRKNLVDFHDLEHFALDILVDKKTKEPKKAAEVFRDTYEEIMIDEYQDSNYVQETLLRAVSREARGSNNIFMVGDVKQSIYRFRLARPELFMEKYDTYTIKESERQRIDLHKNFRSRSEVLEFTNDVFYRIMQKDLGNVAYDDQAALYPGAEFLDLTDNMASTEVLLTDSCEELFAESGFEDKRMLEAKMISQRIRRLKDEHHVTDKETGKLRPVRYSDIVILLRSPGGWADVIASVLNADGIPAHSVSSTGYFSSVEVQTVLSMLRILDNPRQDIPLAAVLRSPIAGMSDEELARVRLTDQECSFHECVLKKCEMLLKQAGDMEPYEQKLFRFFGIYQNIRKIVPDTPVHELIEILLRETGYGCYAAAMPAGKRRQANLFMLIEKASAYENTSYKGLFHFVRYIDELQKYQIDFGEADLTGENEDVVRIMSIHKSKGLEFPIVFVSGMGKQFNRQDTKSRLILHPDLGIGLDCIDGVRRLRTPTIVKKALARQIELENAGEELRVLYVAFTRAKEKLIVTADRKDAQSFLEKERERMILTGRRGALSYLARAGAAGYLDWIIPAVCSYGEKYQIRVVPVAELVTGEIGIQANEAFRKESCLCAISSADQEDMKKYDDLFSFRYPNEAQIGKKNKYSVSELKRRSMRRLAQQEEEELYPVFPEEEIIPYIPAFARLKEGVEEAGNMGALRGTAMHRVMECYRFDLPDSPDEQMEAMLKAGMITEEIKELVIPGQIEKFLRSDLARRMGAAEAAGRLYREKPFVMGLSGEEMAKFGFGDDTDRKCGDLTLIQGIIDVFWVEEDGIVLLDYKTDHVDCAKQLKDRYNAQLMLYGEALNRIFAKDGEQPLRVKECLLYSFRLGETVR